MTLADRLFIHAKLLPDPLVRETLDFVLFLRQWQERIEIRDLMHAQSLAPQSTWDNEEDEVWNDV